MKVALAGNPNSGKTTMYNSLTGSNETVGNWAGVTVDKKEAYIKKALVNNMEILAVDLPGAYSMSAFTTDESIASSYIKNENPDVIINIVDATNLSRSLFFTTQLLELKIPVVVALNKSDVNRKKKTVIDAGRLSKLLGCPVVSTVSVSNEGLSELIKTAISHSKETQTAPYTEGEVDYRSRVAVFNADRKRFSFVNKIVKEVESRKVLTRDRSIDDKIDAVLTNKWLGIPLFALVMTLVFVISQSLIGPYIADALTALLESFKEWVRGLISGASPLLVALLVDGVIGGVIAVIGFLPLVMIMYFLIALLEDCGYMSRAAVVLDPIFKRVGLSGKSVIPFVISVGCAVPGVMASRTIRNERERKATVMLAPFMPCGAKIPVISLFAGAFFNNSGLVSAAMYFVGIVLIFVGALLVNKITGYRARKSFFIIELPEYKAPSLIHALKSMVARGWEYIVKAATIILLCNTAVQLMQSFDLSFNLTEVASESILATVATPIAYLLVPIVGALSWELAAAVVTGFIAKENVVGTLAVCFAGLSNLIDAEELSIIEGAGGEVAGIMAITKAAALAYLVFNLYSPPCFAAIGAMNTEMKSGKWLLGALSLQLGVGYTVAYIVYTVGTLITSPQSLNITAAMLGGAAVLVFALIIGALIYRAGREKER